MIANRVANPLTHSQSLLSNSFLPYTMIEGLIDYDNELGVLHIENGSVSFLTMSPDEE